MKKLLLLALFVLTASVCLTSSSIKNTTAEHLSKSSLKKCSIADFCDTIGTSAQEAIVLPAYGEKFLLNTGWLARKASEITKDGNRLSSDAFDTTGWMPARVPGTVLTTMLDNGLFPKPEFSLNNTLIPDIFDVGNDYYTYWFVKEFDLNELPTNSNSVMLNFRGINYKADIFFNGKRLNHDTHEGMFLRVNYDITKYLKQKGNRLAVIVYPPDPAGNPNGGQGGDGMIARNVTMQFTPGWDWIQPVHDRNTGIWDEVSLTVSRVVLLQHPFVRTRVPGVRHPNGKQPDAYIQTSVEITNLASTSIAGVLICETNGQKQTQHVRLDGNQTRLIELPEQNIKNPRLWWPNGVGRQELYDMNIRFEIGNGQIYDLQNLRYGIREISSTISTQNGGRIFQVNGQPIYITGGNYIASDWLLRLSRERYRDEVRFHAEMNLRMIRIWGGALLERPDFYDACDEYGILVFQDLWGSGDCNGAWNDPKKKESRERRWEYPDNHSLFLTSVQDQVRLIRNHPSLCLWCGANEWPLAADIDSALRTEIFPRLDPDRMFISYSTDTLFTANTIGGVGDGPYGIQEPEWFFTFRSTPFNPEAGSVGSPEVESMREMMTEDELADLPHGRKINATWTYHKDLGYGDHLERYGVVNSIESYCKYAQVVNYDQYRSFMEGRASKMWEWYTGILIWKTQNPWTSLRGQMYDWFLDVNATLYGTRKGCETLHPQYNLSSKEVEVINTSLDDHDLELTAQVYKTDGTIVWSQKATTKSVANSVKRLFAIPVPESVDGVYFLKLSISEDNHPKTNNIYWLTTRPKDYTGLAQLPKSKLSVLSELKSEGSKYSGLIHLKAEDGISFFNRLKIFNKATRRRILPVHYSDNYITLMPGDEQTVNIEFSSSLPASQIEILVEGWN